MSSRLHAFSLDFAPAYLVLLQYIGRRRALGGNVCGANPPDAPADSLCGGAVRHLTFLSPWRNIKGGLRCSSLHLP